MIVLLVVFGILVGIFTLSTIIVWVVASVKKGSIIKPSVLFEAELTSSQISEMKDLNTPYKCKCGIVSRKYQFKGKINTVCPHCEMDLYEDSRYWFYNGMDKYEISEQRSFPFAPVLTNKQFITKWKEKEKLQKIKKQLKELEEYDKEIEAWENIQLKKMEEYQEKANQIKDQLERGVYER